MTQFEDSLSLSPFLSLFFFCSASTGENLFRVSLDHSLGIALLYSVICIEEDVV